MHASTVLRRLVAVAGLLAITTGLAACAESAEPTDALAIVVGARSNMPPPALEGRALAAREDAVMSQAYVAVVVADGQPFVMDPAGVLVARDDNPVTLERDRAANREAVLQLVAAARAETPETDLLAALEVARRAVSSVPGQHTVVVSDSGLSTAGALDFAADPTLLFANPEELARNLKNAGQLPDLRGIDVILQGIGDVADPQPVLSLAQRKKLIAIWEAIVAAAQADTVQLDETPLRGEPDRELPPVTTVPIPDGETCTVERETLTEGEVAFVADSAEFRDWPTAQPILALIADKILAQGYTAVLTGTTADVGDDAGQIELSDLRAQAVGSVLVTMGVPSDRITAFGVGSGFPGYRPDRNADGSLDPEAAAANRTVIVELAGAADVHCR